MDPAVRRMLGDALGPRALGDRRDIVAPASVAHLVTVCTVCAQNATPMAVTSGVEGAVPPGGILVSVAALDAVEVDEGAAVCRAGAGATAGAVLTAARSVALAPVGEAWASGARHVGSLVARGAIPRRALCGVEAVLTTGEHIVAGGAMLKDVAGYDVIAALLGSAGRLGLIAGVTVRLVPAGARDRAQPAPGESDDSGMGELMRRAFDPHHLLRGAR